jgi:hypothetical protein
VGSLTHVASGLPQTQCGLSQLADDRCSVTSSRELTVPQGNRGGSSQLAVTKSSGGEGTRLNRQSSIVSTASSDTLIFNRLSSGLMRLTSHTSALSECGGSMESEVAFPGQSQTAYEADDRGYAVALRLDSRWCYKGEFDTDIGEKLLRELLRHASGTQALI